MKLPSKFIKEQVAKWEEDVSCPPTDMERRAYIDGLVDAAAYWKWKEKK